MNCASNHYFLAEDWTTQKHFWNEAPFLCALAYLEIRADHWFRVHRWVRESRVLPADQALQFLLEILVFLLDLK